MKMPRYHFTVQFDDGHKVQVIAATHDGARRKAKLLAPQHKFICSTQGSRVEPDAIATQE